MTTLTGYEPLYALKPFGEELWTVDGPHISFYGIPFPTRMTFMRLDDGSLFVHSPIALDDGLRRAVDAIGVVRHLVAPNWIHYAYLPEWQRAYPDSVLYAAPGVEARAKKYGVSVRIDTLLTDEPPAAWAEQIDQVVAEGSEIHREVVFFHRRSRTLIVTDLIENFESEKCPLWTRPILGLIGTYDPDGKAPLDMRMMFRFGHGGRGRSMLRDAVERMIAWDPVRVVVAHGRCYDENGTAELRRAFRWVL
jgi:hypothetical protein